MKAIAISLAVFCMASILMAQKTPSFAQLIDPISPIQRLTLHEETPGHCLAFYSPDRIMWDTAWQQTYTYNTAGQLFITQHDIYQAPGMRRSTRQHAYYDTAGQLIDRVTENDSAGSWKNAIREMWYYDANGSETMAVQLQWRLLPGGYGWDTSSATRYHIVYGPQNQIAERTTRYWTTSFPMGIWTNASKHAYFFNAQNQWDSLVIYSPFGPNWAAGQRIVGVTWADYALGQRSRYVIQYNQGGWINGQRTQCTYQGLSSNCMIESYGTGVWDTAGRAVAHYDAQDHLTLAEQYDWLSGQWSTVNGEQHDYTYDSLGQTLELIDRNWDPQFQGYVQGLRRIYGDYFLASAPRAHPDISIVAYPNPATDVLHLQIDGLKNPAQLTVYDMQGRIRLTQIGQPQSGTLNVPLDISLPNGSYTYRLIARQGHFAGKFLIAR